MSEKQIKNRKNVLESTQNFKNWILIDKPVLLQDPKNEADDLDDFTEPNNVDCEPLVDSSSSLIFTKIFSDVDELSEDMRVKSRMLLAKNLEQTKAFYKKLKGYVDFLGTPSYSKDELRQKRRLAENISRLMFEEEQKLKKGQSLSSLGDLGKLQIFKSQ